MLPQRFQQALHPLRRRAVAFVDDGVSNRAEVEIEVSEKIL